MAFDSKYAINHAINYLTEAAQKRAAGGWISPKEEERRKKEAAREQQRATKENGGGIGWSKNRLKREIHISHYDDGRSKSHVGYVNPIDFLRSTTSNDEELQEIIKRAGDLDQEKIEKEIQSPFLIIKDGKIRGHEGRHRMAALAKAGYKMAPVAIHYSGDRGEFREPIDSATFGHQYNDKGTSVTVSNMIPLHQDYANQINEMMARHEDNFASGGQIFSKQFPTHYMPNVGRQVMQDGGMPKPLSQIINRNQDIQPSIPDPSPEDLSSARADTRVGRDIVAKRLNTIVPESERVVGGKYRPGAPGGGRWSDLPPEVLNSPGRGFNVTDEELQNLWHQSLSESSEAAKKAANDNKVKPKFLAKDWDKAMRLPLSDHLWYELSGEKMAENMPDLTHPEFLKLMDLIGATSARAKPGENLERSLGALSQHLRKTPIDVDLTIPETVRQALGRSHEGSSALPGNKTGYFSDTLALTGGVPTRMPISVNDVWVGKMFGVPDNVMSSNQSLHEPMAKYFNKIRDLYNERHGHEVPFPYQSWNFQAPAWVHLRGEEAGEESGDAYHQVWDSIINKLKDKNIPGIVGNQITREALMHPDFADALRRTTAPFRSAPKATVEFGTKLTNVGETAHQHYQRAVQANDALSQNEYLGGLTKAMYASARGEGHPWERLKKAITGTLGQAGDITRIAHPVSESPLDIGGTFEGDVSPNIRVPLKDMSDDQIAYFNAIAGKHLKQKSMAASYVVDPEGPETKPREGHIRGYSAFVPTTEGMDPNDIRSFASELSKIGHDMSYARYPNGYRFDVIPNYNLDIPKGIDHDQLANAYDATLKNKYGDPAILAHDFKSIYTPDTEYDGLKSKLVKEIQGDFIKQAKEAGIPVGAARKILAKPSLSSSLKGRSAKAWDTYSKRVDHLSAAEKGFKDLAQRVSDAHSDFIVKAEKRQKKYRDGFRDGGSVYQPHQRAEEQGYSIRGYHVTRGRRAEQISSAKRFDPYMAQTPGEEAAFFWDNPDAANEWANHMIGEQSFDPSQMSERGIDRAERHATSIMPVRIHPGKTATIDWIEATGRPHYNNQKMAQIIRHARDLGFDTLRIKNMIEGEMPNAPQTEEKMRAYKPADQIAVLNPHVIRSEFAEFDPHKFGREDLGAARGGMINHDELSKAAHAGRNGDTLLAHINPQEAAMLRRMGGAGTINPRTGLPEFSGADPSGSSVTSSNYGGGSSTSGGPGSAPGSLGGGGGNQGNPIGSSGGGGGGGGGSSSSSSGGGGAPGSTPGSLGGGGGNQGASQQVMPGLGGAGAGAGAGSGTPSGRPEGAAEGETLGPDAGMGIGQNIGASYLTKALSPDLGSSGEVMSPNMGIQNGVLMGGMTPSQFTASPLASQAAMLQSLGISGGSVPGAMPQTLGQSTNVAQEAQASGMQQQPGAEDPSIAARTLQIANQISEGGKNLAFTGPGFQPQDPVSGYNQQDTARAIAWGSAIGRGINNLGQMLSSQPEGAMDPSIAANQRIMQSTLPSGTNVAQEAQASGMQQQSGPMDPSIVARQSTTQTPSGLLGGSMGMPSVFGGGIRQPGFITQDTGAQDPSQQANAEQMAKAARAAWLEANTEPESPRLGDLAVPAPSARLVQPQFPHTPTPPSAYGQATPQPAFPHTPTPFSQYPQDVQKAMIPNLSDSAFRPGTLVDPTGEQTQKALENLELAQNGLSLLQNPIVRMFMPTPTEATPEQQAQINNMWAGSLNTSVPKDFATPEQFARDYPSTATQSLPHPGQTSDAYLSAGPSASIGRQDFGTSAPSAVGSGSPVDAYNQSQSSGSVSAVRNDFNQAFAAARAEGRDVFPWTNPLTGQTLIYTTALARKDGGRVPSLANPENWLAHVKIDTPKGKRRDHHGAKPLPVDYGHIAGTKGADGMDVDAFVGPNKKSDKAFVINQQHPQTKKFDEHKIMFGFDSKAQALDAYRKSYPVGLAERMARNVISVPAKEAVVWAKNGKTSQPAARDTIVKRALMLSSRKS